uniref:Sesquiterpene synthase n=1 Tax=Piper betle TaxID=13217 RepID=A0A1X9H811_9MAGN|nr:sesquiterpene synthase [Piper betle]
MASSFVTNAAIAAHKPPSKQDIIRRDAKFHPTIWGDHFIQYSDTPIDPPQNVVARMEDLKKQVREMLRDTNLDISLIDWIQRTGIAYHFEEEIAEGLKHVYEASTMTTDSSKYLERFDLRHIALRFRLSRQQGYHLSTDVFERFMDEGDKFKQSIANDIEGMLSLYEASYMSVKGEAILDEALAFTSKNLKATLPNLTGSLAQQVECALEIPLHRCTDLVKARRSISCYENKKGRNEVVLELAKLDFNLLQAVHQRELALLTSWWNELGAATNLPFTRNRVVELYFWVLEVLSKPEHARAREIMVKNIIMASILDDVYDIYGTLEELQLFTSALERWDLQAPEQVSNTIKTAYSIVLRVFKESEDLLKPHEVYRVRYARKALIPYIKAYFLEAKWFYSHYYPSFEEYMDNALVTCGYPYLFLVSLVGLDEITAKDVFEWAIKRQNIVVAASIICRNRDDIVGHKEEQERGDSPSGVQCYMKDHGCTEEEACMALQAMVDDAWKDINYELLHETSVPKAILMRAVGLARVISILYQYRDGYSDPTHETKAHVTQVFVQPIPL